MAQLDEILNKYVKPGAEAQALQGSAFIVKDKHGMLLMAVRSHCGPVSEPFIVILQLQGRRYTPMLQESSTTSPDHHRSPQTPSAGSHP
jgi:hypothetical protein